MTSKMPSSESYEGLSRQVLRYSEAFARLAANARQRRLEEGDWAEIEQLVDVAGFERVGVFLTPQAEVIDWPTYRHYVSEYAGHTTWDGTLRAITEVPGRVIMELEEYNTRGGETDTSWTVTIYEFTDAGKLRHLDVYVMPRGVAPAG